MRLIFKMLMLAITLAATNVSAEGFSASVGADYATGKYGSSSSTDELYVPFSGSYSTGAFTYKVTVPWIRVTGDGTVIPSGSGGSVGEGGGVVDCRKRGTGACTNVAAGGGGGGGGATTTRTSESGLGDIIAAVTYNAYDGGDQGFVVDLTGRIKFGTASSSRGLGSGENDYSILTNIEKGFGSSYAAVGLGYKFLGEPDGVSLKNIIFGSLGGGYKFTKDTEVGASYDWATASRGGATKPQLISVYGSHRINDSYKLNAELYGGLSNASPDIGGGLTLSYYF